MSRFDEKAMLKEAGFRLLRANGKHLLYSDGTTMIPVHKGSTRRHFAEAAMRSRIRRALEKRGT